MGKFTVEAEHNELVLKNNHGDHVIIPAKNRAWVQRKLQEGCHDCIDRLVESLPIAKEYAGDGTIIPAKKKPQPAKPAPVAVAPPVVATPPSIPPPVVNTPTYDDSLALYNNALQLKQFYENNKQYASDPTRSQPIQTLPVRLNQSLAGMQNKQDRNYRTNVIVDGKRQATVVPVSDFNQPSQNPNQYYQREIENSVLNMNAPMALIDKRIPPNMVQFYREKVDKNPDLVTVATYDPDKIKPKMPPPPPVVVTPSDTLPSPAPVIVPTSVTPKPKKIYTEEEKRKLLKSSAITGRVPFGTSNNRPMNSPGPSGRGGWRNRLDGRGAIPTAVQKFIELFKR